MKTHVVGTQGPGGGPCTHCWDWRTAFTFTEQLTYDEWLMYRWHTVHHQHLHTRDDAHSDDASAAHTALA